MPRTHLLPVTFAASVHAPDDGDLTNNTAYDTAAVASAPPPSASKRIELWPPNHKLSTIDLAQCVVAPAGCTMAHGSFVRGTSDEAVGSGGSGSTSPDILFPNCVTAEVRAERSGSGNGRVYRLFYDATDTCGNKLTGSCRLEVTFSQNGSNATEGTAMYSVDGSAACRF